MSHRITMICDQCEEHYLLNEEMDLPPYWVSMKIFISNVEGLVSESENEKDFIHFCSDKCAANYLTSTDFQNRIRTIDQEIEDNE